MRKTKFSSFLLFFASVGLVLTGCTQPSEPGTSPSEPPSPTSEHTHSWKKEYKYDDTHHWHECEGCEEISPKIAHEMSGWKDNGSDHIKTCVCGFTISEGHRYGASYQDGDVHKADCLDCGHVKSEGHNFGVWTPDPSDSTKHMHVCEDCDYVEKENHVHSNEVSDCSVCGKSIDFIHLDYVGEYDENADRHYKQSTPIAAQNGKTDVFLIESSASSWLVRKQYINFYDSVAEPDIALSNLEIKFYRALNDAAALSSADIVKGDYNITINDQTPSSCYYMSVKVLDASVFTSGSYIIKHLDLENAIPLSFNMLGAAKQFYGVEGEDFVFKFVKPAGIASGSKLKFTHSASIVKEINARGLDGAMTSVPHTSGMNVTEFDVIDDVVYYMTFDYCEMLTISAIKLVSEKSISTSIEGAGNSSGYYSYSIDSLKTFEYKANAMSNSVLTIKLGSAALYYGPSDFEVKLLEASDMTKSFDFNYDEVSKEWRFTLENNANKDLYIQIKSFASAGAATIVRQDDYVTLTRNVNGGVLENNEPIEVVYKKDYASTPIEFGVPTRENYDFMGWEVVSEDGTKHWEVTGPDGVFRNVWGNNASDVDVYKDSLELIAMWRGKYVDRIRLTPNGGTWINGTTSTWNFTPTEASENPFEKYISYGKVLTPNFECIKEGYVFMGFWTEDTYSTTAKMIINHELRVINVADLTENQMLYALYEVEYSPSLITLDSSAQKHYVLNTPDITTSNGKFEYKICVATVDELDTIVSVKDLKTGEKVARNMETTYFELASAHRYLVSVRKNTSEVITNKMMLMAMVRDFYTNKTVLDSFTNLRAATYLIYMNPSANFRFNFAVYSRYSTNYAARAAYLRKASDYTIASDWSRPDPDKYRWEGSCSEDNCYIEFTVQDDVVDATAGQIRIVGLS